MNNNSKHSFHIPIMGLGFTIDTPVKVAQYGISSVISIIDDVLIEKMREIYSEKFEIPFKPIPQKSEDARAKRITAIPIPARTYNNVLSLSSAAAGGLGS